MWRFTYQTKQKLWNLYVGAEWLNASTNAPSRQVNRRAVVPGSTGQLLLDMVPLDQIVIGYTITSVTYNIRNKSSGIEPLYFLQLEEQTGTTLIQTDWHHVEEVTAFC